MSIKIGSFAIWTSVEEARNHGCTHYARMWGVIPGFWGDELSIWVPRSDLFAMLEDALNFASGIIAEIRGDEPAFVFQVRDEIPARAD